MVGFDAPPVVAREHGEAVRDARSASWSRTSRLRPSRKYGSSRDRRDRRRRSRPLRTGHRPTVSRRSPAQTPSSACEGPRVRPEHPVPSCEACATVRRCPSSRRADPAQPTDSPSPLASLRLRGNRRHRQDPDHETTNQPAAEDGQPFHANHLCRCPAGRRAGRSIANLSTRAFWHGVVGVREEKCTIPEPDLVEVARRDVTLGNCAS